ncbi:TetR family transcriptional regulator [Bacillus sp. J14TS2]|uniref:TetR/AcrR family transcriptional regulator n=1 Tax=Bacillus sp. J14TS2 TaxID=2807188 RepID=UPI001B2A2568|nr:TetR/AcrR family transcriptional regulator [Bacillus sp. J14TS2]GIN72751.1 TetR family transcriptional regulator [Bacillus sp. J14TS2]
MKEKMDEGLPRGVALSWGLGKQPKRGPKRELSIEQIVEAAMAIADKEGLLAVSMNRVATSLGFTSMSLYRYIPSKDDLLLLMQDAACDIPNSLKKKDIDWRKNLRNFFHAIVGVYIKHPWFGDIPISGVPNTPNNLKAVDWALGGLRNLPLNDHEKMAIILLISNYARGCGMIQRDMTQAIQAGASPSTLSGQEYSSALKQLVTSEHFPNLQPIIASGVYTDENNENNNVGNDLDFGLERILDGIEHYLQLKGEKSKNE